MLTIITRLTTVFQLVKMNITMIIIPTLFLHPAMTKIPNYKSNKKYNASFNGQNYPGKWRIKSGEVCVNFNDGRKRCDRYLKDGNSIYFEDSGGARYKVKSIK